MQQYFSDLTTPEVGATFTLDEAASHHLFNVMRGKPGLKVNVVFADKRVALAEVLSENTDHELRVLEVFDKNTELPIDVTIAAGFPKGDKLEFITEKVTELGASAIWAYPGKWSVAKWDGKKLAKKQERLTKIAQAAAEQSKRIVIPEVQLFENFGDFKARLADFDRVLVAYEESAKQGEVATLVSTLSEIKAGAKLLVIFGPEGGIAPEEIAIYEAAGAKLAGLGPRILRAETAPLYALSAISYQLEMRKD
jgi:16S rRNA (uracil1498-N3)-methyltransferase